MANATVMEATWNLTSIISKDAINDPPAWLAGINMQLGGWMFVSFIAVFCIVLWIWQRNAGAPDSEAILWSGLIGTIILVLLWVINIAAMPNVKIVTWVQVAPFFIITCIALLLNSANRRY